MRRRVIVNNGATPNEFVIGSFRASREKNMAF